MGYKSPQFLCQRASLTPNRPALTFEERTWTFKEVFHQAYSYAEKLTGAGVKEGQMVGLQMKNSPEMVFIIHALFLIGAQIVMLNGRLSQAEREWQIKDADVSWLISDMETESRVPVLLLNDMDQLPVIDFELKEIINHSDTATIMYTSGTTGKPKAVVQTYGNHYSSAIASALNLGLQTNDKWLCMMPLFHISGLSIVFRSVIYGMEILLHKGFDPSAANKAICEQGATIVSVVTTTLRRMLDDLGEKQYPESFRCMLLGGGAAPMPILEEAVSKRIPVFQTYGMTETSSQIVTLSPEDSLKKIGSSGKPLFSCELMIVKDHKEMPSGQAGEIIVRGPNVTPGYLHGKKKEAFRDGWFHTGDIGYLDEEGFLYVLDRRSDLIISGGENIYPAELESVLSEHPAVSEAGVTGLDDAVWGKVPVAVVTTRSGISVTIKELQEYCEKRLARYKVPKQIKIVEQLPRNASNKLVRNELKKYFL